jgi:hypothetical protein
VGCCGVRCVRGSAWPPVCATLSCEPGAVESGSPYVGSSRTSGILPRPPDAQPGSVPLPQILSTREGGTVRSRDPCSARPRRVSGGRGVVLVGIRSQRFLFSFLQNPLNGLQRVHIWNCARRRHVSPDVGISGVPCPLLS